MSELTCGRCGAVGEATTRWLNAEIGGKRVVYCHPCWFYLLAAMDMGEGPMGGWNVDT